MNDNMDTVTLRIAGNLLPDVPTMLNFPTLPRRRKSNRVRPTTPTFLSDWEPPVPTKPVVYSPVPTWKLLGIDFDCVIQETYHENIDWPNIIFLLAAYRLRNYGNFRHLVCRMVWLVEGVCGIYLDVLCKLWTKGSASINAWWWKKSPKMEDRRWKISEIVETSRVSQQLQP